MLIREAAQVAGKQLEGAKVIIQGFGNAGSFLAKFLHDAGALVVGISDAYGALFDSEGLDVQNLLDNRDSFGAVTNLFKTTISNQELLIKECDILVPAAIDNQITEENAAQIKARIVVEAANGPTTMKATEILTNKNVLLVPDVLASSGGVIVSYFEWVQNNQGYYWSEEEVHEKLQFIMSKSFHNVYQTSLDKKVDMRLASYIVGLKRMVEAMKWRGWI